MNFRKIYQFNSFCELRVCFLVFFSSFAGFAKAQVCDSLDHVVISVNGERVKADAASGIEIVKGDLLTVFEGWCKGTNKPVKIDYFDFVGFAPKRARQNKQDDSNFVIDTARDLQLKFAKDSQQTEFDLVAKISTKSVGTIKIKLVNPRLDRVEMSINGSLRQLKSGDTLELGPKDKIAVKRVVTNVRGNDNIEYELVSADINSKNLQRKELVFSRDGAVIGKIFIQWAEM